MQGDKTTHYLNKRSCCWSCDIRERWNQRGHVRHDIDKNMESVGQQQIKESRKLPEELAKTSRQKLCVREKEWWNVRDREERRWCEGEQKRKGGQKNAFVWQVIERESMIDKQVELRQDRWEQIHEERSRTGGGSRWMKEKKRKMNREGRTLGSWWGR